jgi:hypothetical protein
MSTSAPGRTEATGESAEHLPPAAAEVEDNLTWCRGADVLDEGLSIENGLRMEWVDSGIW